MSRISNKMRNIKKKCATRARNWTISELELFAQVLADEENSFAISLEKLALKKSANMEVFGCLKKVFDVALKSDVFKKKKEENFKLKDSSI